MCCRKTVDYYAGFDVDCKCLGALLAREVFASIRRNTLDSQNLHRIPGYLHLFAALAERIKAEGISLRVKTEDAILRFLISEWTHEVIYETKEGWIKSRYEARWPCYIPDFEIKRNILISVAEAFNRAFERKCSKAIERYNRDAVS